MDGDDELMMAVVKFVIAVTFLTVEVALRWVEIMR